jgi:hypothetical protein
MVDNSEIEAISTAIADVCEEFFIKKSIKFDVILYGESTGHLNDIFDRLLDKVVSRSLITVSNVQDITLWHHKLNKSALIFCGSEFYLNEFSTSTKLSNTFPEDFIILTFYKNIADVMWQHISMTNSQYTGDKTSVVSHQYYLGNSKHGEFVLMVSVDHFGEKLCNNPQTLVINKFNKFTGNWNKPLEFYEKFSNFYGCPLAVVDNFGPYLYLNQRSKEISECFVTEYQRCVELLVHLAETVGLQGFSVDIFSMLGTALNFTPIFSFMVVKWPLNVPKVSIYVSTYDQILKGYAPTSLNYVNTFVMAATPREFYSNYEKMWLPFDKTTWMLLMITFLAAFVVTVGQRFAPKFVRNSITGSNVTSPTLNVVEVFLDNSLTNLPKDSFPRFILILFILFCLIFRTLYQSKSFDLMTSDVRKPPPHSIEDLIKRNYTIVSFALGHEKFLEEMVPNVSSR